MTRTLSFEYTKDITKPFKMHSYRAIEEMTFLLSVRDYNVNVFGIFLFFFLSSFIFLVQSHPSNDNCDDYLWFVNKHSFSWHRKRQVRGRLFVLITISCNFYSYWAILCLIYWRIEDRSIMEWNSYNFAWAKCLFVINFNILFFFSRIGVCVWGEFAFNIIEILFLVYFRLNMVRNCRPVFVVLHEWQKGFINYTR